MFFLSFFLFHRRQISCNDRSFGFRFFSIYISTFFSMQHNYIHIHRPQQRSDALLLLLLPSGKESILCLVVYYIRSLPSKTPSSSAQSTRRKGRHRQPSRRISLIQDRNFHWHSIVESLVMIPLRDIKILTTFKISTWLYSPEVESILATSLGSSLRIAQAPERAPIPEMYLAALTPRPTHLA